MSHQRQSILIWVGVIALSFNLRPAATSVGPLLAELQSDLGMSAVTAGVLTTLPVLCFAGFGALAPWTGRTFGIHRTMFAALVLTAICLLVRAQAPTAIVFLILTVPALAGMATANVLMPSLIKRDFPDRIGLMTAVYATTLSIGMTTISALTVPIAEAAGSWRWGLAVWGLTAALAAIPWIGLLAHDVRPESGQNGTIGFAQVVRTRLGWWMALFFGLQSLQAYAIFGWMPEIFRDAGFSASQAGLLLALTTSVAIPVSFVLPRVAAARSDQRAIVVFLASCYVVGYAGLAASPSTGAIAWCLLIGLGQGVFPLVLTFIGLRARTSDGTAALSGFTQSIGYVISAVGPFMMGAIYDITNSWTVPILVLLCLAFPLCVVGILVARPRYLEDEIERADLSRTVSGSSA